MADRRLSRRSLALALCAVLALSSFFSVQVCAQEGCEEEVSKVKKALADATSRADAADVASKKAKDDLAAVTGQRSECVRGAEKLRKDLSEQGKKLETADKKAVDLHGKVSSLEKKANELEGVRTKLTTQVSSTEAKAKAAETAAEAAKLKIRAAEKAVADAAKDLAVALKVDASTPLVESIRKAAAVAARETQLASELRSVRDQLVRVQQQAGQASTCGQLLQQAQTEVKEAKDALFELQEQLQQLSLKWLPVWLEDVKAAALASSASVWSENVLPATAALQAQVSRRWSEASETAAPHISKLTRSVSSSVNSAVSELQPHMASIREKIKPVVRCAVSDVSAAAAPYAAVATDKVAQWASQAHVVLAPYINKTREAVMPHVQTARLHLEPHVRSVSAAAAPLLLPLQPHALAYHARVQQLVVDVVEFATDGKPTEEWMQGMVIFAHVLLALLALRVLSAILKFISAPKKAKKAAAKKTTRSRHHHHRKSTKAAPTK